MKGLLLVLTTALGAVLMLNAADESGSGESENKLPPAPDKPRYRVISANGRADHDEAARRKQFEDELNAASRDGYSLAAMNNEWAVLELLRPSVSPTPSPARRRVVLPTE